MADEAEKQKGGRPKNLGNTETISISIPESLHRYLMWLARHSFFGSSVNDVAARLLSERALQLFDAKHHDQKIPD